MKVKDQIDGISDLKRTFYHKDLTAAFIPGVGGKEKGTVAILQDAVTEESIAQLVQQGVRVTSIPLEEGLRQGMNAVVLWGHKHGGSQFTESIVIMPPGCPVLQKCFEGHGFVVHTLPFGSPSGGGNWECETNFALSGFSPIAPHEQIEFARRGNKLLQLRGLESHFRFICERDLDGFDWTLDQQWE